MSASKKRKERQAFDLSNATDKQRREAQAAQQEQTKAKIYWAIGIVTAVLIVALLVWNSGIFQRKTTAATVNGQDYTVSDMSFYYGNVFNSILNMQNQYSGFYSQLGMEFTNIYDAAKSPKDQVITEETVATLSGMGINDAEAGQTFDDFFQAQALSGLQSDMATVAAAKEAGYTLSDEGKATIDDTIASYKDAATSANYSLGSYLKASYGSYMTTKVFEQRVADSVLASEYQTVILDTPTYTDDDYATYYDENAAMMDTYDFRMAFISGMPEAKKDDAGEDIAPTVEEISAAMVLAEEAAQNMVSAIEDGATFNEAAAQYVSEASQSLYEDEEYNHITTSLGGTLASSTYGAWLVEGGHATGDIKVIQDTTSNGYFVIQYLGQSLNEDTLYSSEIRHILVKAEVDEAAEGEVAVPTDDQMAAAKAKAEEIQAEFESGAKTAEDFATLADTYSEDPGSNGSNVDNGGASGGFYEVTASSNFFADFQNWALDGTHAVGDLGLIENTQSGQEGYHIMYFQAPGMPSWKNTADTALRGEAFGTWFEDLLAATPATAVAEGMNLLN